MTLRSLKTTFTRLLLASALLLCGRMADAQVLKFYEGEPVQVLFVLDVSNSMAERWETDTKWNAATKILGDFTKELDEIDNLQMALRAYGHRSDPKKHNCKDSELLVEMSDNTSISIEKALERTKPTGITPLSYALKKSLKDFKSDGSKKKLVLITDGKESCNTNPCDLMPLFTQENIEIIPILIGERIPAYFIEDYTCMGDVYLATSPDEFKEDLVGKQKDEEEVPERKGSLQVFLNDSYGKPSETNVNMTIFESGTDIRVMNVYHSLDVSGQPEKIFIRPGIYDIQVHTTPTVVVHGVEVKPEENVVATAKTPQGSIIFNIEGPLPRGVGTFNWNVIVQEKGTGNTLYTQRNNQSKRYITGHYNAEVLTLPRIIYRNIEVKQSVERVETIPSPGMLHIVKESNFIGGLFIKKNAADKKIYDLKQNPKEMILLQPGDYWVVYRKKGDSLLESRVKRFSIDSGNTITLRL